MSSMRFKMRSARTRSTRITEWRSVNALKAIKELFKFGRYRPAKAGKFSVGEPAENTGGSADEDAAKADGKSTRGGATGGKRGDIYALFTEEGGQPADLVESPIEPERSWISVEDG